MAKEQSAADKGGVLGALKEGLARGTSVSKILGDVGSELKQMGAHGAHELSAAIFNGSAFVMYPRFGQDQVEDPKPDLEPLEHGATKPVTLESLRGQDAIPGAAQEQQPTLGREM